MKSESSDQGGAFLETMGGVAGVAMAVDAFYDRVLADEVLQPFFASVDTPQLRLRQTQFLAQALGGPREYHGPDLRTSHAYMPISDAHFDQVVAHFSAAMRSLGAADSSVHHVEAMFETMRIQIVSA